MAERTVIDCDGCGTQNIPQHAKIFIVTGRSMDPSGNGCDDDGELVHLCIKCCESKLHRVVEKSEYSDNQVWLTEIRSRRRDRTIQNHSV